MSTARASADDVLAADDIELLRRNLADDPVLLAALERVEKAVNAALESHATLVSDLGHELRTPLNAVLGFTHLLRQDSGLGAEQRAHVEVIYRSGEQLLELIDDLLDSWRDEEGQAQGFDLHALLDDIADMLYLRTAGAAVRLRIDREADLPRRVRTDQTRLRQLLLLLIANVVQSAAVDDVLVRVQLERAPAVTSGILRCAIASPLMKPETLRFQPFAKTGEGLQAQGEPRDLKYASELAEQLSGRLHASTGLLRVELPVELGPTDADDLRSADRKVIGLAPDQPEFRVLVAEDRWQSRQLMVQVLERAGFQVREAADGREALMLWDTWRPHLVWMDMRMPVMTGMEATQRIKQSPGGAQTVVIALTASAFEADQATARSAGCDDFVRKPVQMHEVFAKLSQHLGVQFIYEAPAAAPAPVTINTEALMGMPVPWLEALQQASVQADLGAILRMIDHIRSQAPRVAAILTDLAERYNYDSIIGLSRHALEAARGGA